eukprot:jgi/Phyca11/107992/e_gw1.14.832.1
MTKSSDLRWRAVSLIHVYDVDIAHVASILGVSKRSVERWYGWFLNRGTVEGKGRKHRTSRWPQHVCQFVREYAQSRPCFYIDELRSALRARFATLRNTSEATICGAPPLRSAPHAQGAQQTG